MHDETTEQTTSYWPNRILVVERNEESGNEMKIILAALRYNANIFFAYSAEEALKLCEKIPFDLVLIEIQLRDMDGLLLIAKLRHMYERLRVIVCSNTRRHRDAVLSLRIGADDFIRKPFDNNEFSARIDAIFRRVVPPKEEEREPDQIQVGDLVNNQTRHHVTLKDDELHLTPIEYRLLRTLASKPDVVFSRYELAMLVWGYREPSLERGINAHIRRLRAKLSFADTPCPKIVTVREYGYKLVSHTTEDHIPVETVSSNGLVAAGH